MISVPEKLDAADLFCGAGGMTTGAEQSGIVRPVLAVNHWQTAIFSHQNNHPDTRHICARIEDFNLRDDRLPEFDLLMAGIECVHHSNARGAAPINDQARASAWRVLDWMQRFMPRWCVFENVREFLKWGPVDEDGRKIKERECEIFDAWIAAIRSLGYRVDWKLLNAADYGAHTKRIRLFIVCRLNTTVSFHWPQQTHFQPPKESRDRLWDVPYWRPAYEIIDFSKPCPSIFNRKRPLADKTLRRIRIGLEKFVENNPTPFIVKYHGGRDPRRDGTERQYSILGPLPVIDSQPRFALASPVGIHLRGTATAWDLAEPAPTMTAGGNHFGIALPIGVNLKGKSDGYDIGEALPTQTAHAAHLGIAAPYMTANFGERPGQDPRCFGVDRPANVITPRGAGNLIVPFLYQLIGRGAGRSYPLGSSVPTIVAARNTVGLISPFLVQSQGPGWGCDRYEGVFDPFTAMPTILGRNNHAVVTPFLMPRQGFYDCQRLKRCADVYESLPTITASHSPAHLVMPFLVDPNWQENRGGRNRIHDLGKPLGTITTCNQKHLCVPYFVDVNHGDDRRTGDRSFSIQDSLGTLTSRLGKGVVFSRLTHHFGNPPRISAHDHRGTVLCEQPVTDIWPKVENPRNAMQELLDTMKRIGVYDIGFRMLDIDELKAAQGFPADYELHGNKAEQVKQIGNSVCPAVMKAICESIGEQDG